MRKESEQVKWVRWAGTERGGKPYSARMALLIYKNAQLVGLPHFWPLLRWTKQIPPLWVFFQESLYDGFAYFCSNIINGYFKESS